MSESWWLPEHFTRKRAVLERRAACLRATRRFFDDAGFMEVETPALQVSPGMEPHIKFFSTALDEPFGAGTRSLHLHTSPEFAMKKLLVAGMERIYQVARVFRNGERSDLHHPEFAMIEWYRVGESLEALMADCEGLIRALPEWSAGCDRDAPFERLTVAEAFERYADVDLLPTFAAGEADPDPARLAREAQNIGLEPRDGERWEDIFFRIFLERIEPKLGRERPTFLTHYPAPMAALARTVPDQPKLALRFELYVDGVELANAFDELTDAKEQRTRFAHDAALRQRLYGLPAPIDEDFLAALERGLPPSVGIALGFDRLVMLATGSKRIEDVLWALVAGE